MARRVLIKCELCGKEAVVAEKLDKVTAERAIEHLPNNWRVVSLELSRSSTVEVCSFKWSPVGQRSGTRSYQRRRAPRPVHRRGLDMWLSELEKGIKVWFYGKGDPWNVYTGTVRGWSAEQVFLNDLSFDYTYSPFFSMPIYAVSADPLEPRLQPPTVYVDGN